MFKDPLTKKITDFLNLIGINVTAGKFKEKVVLPGILIKDGKLIVFESKLLYPGDLLHEAGHLAVKPASERNSVYINCGNDPAEEMMALAWAYAASVYINIHPEVVFHEYGYKGEAKLLIERYQNGIHIGLPMLQWVGMSADDKNATSIGVDPFPHMIKWLRD
jgi:hypothetical protein